MTRFLISVNGGPVRHLDVASDIYRDAAAAVPATLGIPTPITVRIWRPDVSPGGGPYFYRVEAAQNGGLRIYELIG
jgi:hypothetical protein